MHLEELDIEAMRAAILKDQYEACKPFQEELRKLEILEQLVNRTRKSNGYAVKPNGHVKKSGKQYPYRGVRAGRAIKEILSRESGLTSKELVDRMEYGGYRFTSENPIASLGTTLRKMVLNNTLQAEKTNGLGTPKKYFLKEGA